MSPIQAEQVILAGAGDKYHPGVVEALEKILTGRTFDERAQGESTVNERAKGAGAGA
jgi:hypothetical protein